MGTAAEADCETLMLAPVKGSNPRISGDSGGGIVEEA